MHIIIEVTNDFFTKHYPTQLYLTQTYLFAKCLTALSVIKGIGYQLIDQVRITDAILVFYLYL